jgi:[acyl-carrier-protein] S-malonyltransferase
MEPVQKRLGEVMNTLQWSPPSTPLVSNASGEIVDTANGVHQALVAQIASPVQWVACVKKLREAGVTRFLELGSGRVLTGLVRQIDPEVDTAAADTPAKIARFAQSQTASV